MAKRSRNERRERGIFGEILDYPRFRGAVVRDERGNAIFPHYDAERLAGTEKIVG